MKKVVLSLISLLIILAILFYLDFIFNNKKLEVKKEMSTAVGKEVSSDLKEYKDFGINFKYPKSYTISGNNFLTDNVWRSATIFSLYKKDDSVQKNKFKAIPLYLVVEKQPTVSKGKIFSNTESMIREYYENPPKTFINKKGIIFIEEFTQKGEFLDSDLHSYVFVHNNLIYNFFLNAEDVEIKKIIDELSVF